MKTLYIKGTECLRIEVGVDRLDERLSTGLQDGMQIAEWGKWEWCTL